MRMLRSVVISNVAASLMGLQGSVASAQNQPAGPAVWGEVVEFGIYKTRERGQLHFRPETTAGRVWENTGEMVLVDATEQVPLQQGVTFCFRYRIEGLPEGRAELDWFVRHPPITSPDGKTSTGYSYPRPVFTRGGVATGTDCYELEHSFELVAGEWVLGYANTQGSIVQQRFDVVAP